VPEYSARCDAIREILSSIEHSDAGAQTVGIATIAFMKNAIQRVQLAFSLVGRGVLAFALLSLIVLSLAGCDNPLGDSDDIDTPAPIETPAPVPDQPQTNQETPEAEAEQEERDDGWTVITGREQVDPPESRGSHQVFRMAGPSDAPTTIDPALVRDTTSSFLARQVFRGLIRLDATLEPTPDLASQVEISPDGTVYRFTLHDSITFHDGSPITAAHVKESLERATDPMLMGGDGHALPSRNYLDDIEGARERMDGERDDIPGIVVVDERTIEISLEHGVVDFLERMSNSSTLIVDVSETTSGSDWWLEPNGTGPFRLVEWDADRQITLAAHDGYVHPPFLESVEYRVGAEAVGQMQLYETDQIDFVHVPLSVLDRVQYEGSPIRGSLREEPLLSTSFILMNPSIEPYNDQAFREAIANVIPRDALTEIMLEGRVQTAQGVLPPVMLGNDVQPYPFEMDPDRGRSSLGSIQLPEDFERVTIYGSGGAIPTVMKHFIEAELGLEVEVVQLRWSDYTGDMEDGRLPMFVLTWVADGPDPVSFMRALFHSESPDNYARFNDPDVDDLLDQAAIEQDEQERSRLIQEAHRLILESAVVVPLYHSVDYVLVSDNVAGLESTPMGIQGLESVRIVD
jgi:ABC-type transport system substrate-binding protein